jgi:hypothetical protein
MIEKYNLLYFSFHMKMDYTPEQINRENRITKLKEIAKSLGIVGFSKYTSKDIDKLRNLIIGKIDSLPPLQINPKIKVAQPEIKATQPVLESKDLTIPIWWDIRKIKSSTKFKTDKDILTQYQAWRAKPPSVTINHDEIGEIHNDNYQFGKNQTIANMIGADPGFLGIQYSVKPKLLETSMLRVLEYKNRNIYLIQDNIIQVINYIRNPNLIIFDANLAISDGKSDLYDPRICDKIDHYIHKCKKRENIFDSLYTLILKTPDQSTILILAPNLLYVQDRLIQMGYELVNFYHKSISYHRDYAYNEFKFPVTRKYNIGTYAKYLREGRKPYQFKVIDGSVSLYSARKEGKTLYMFGDHHTRERLESCSDLNESVIGIIDLFLIMMDRAEQEKRVLDIFTEDDLSVQSVDDYYGSRASDIYINMIQRVIGRLVCLFIYLSPFLVFPFSFLNNDVFIFHQMFCVYKQFVCFNFLFINFHTSALYHFSCFAFAGKHICFFCQKIQYCYSCF